MEVQSMKSAIDAFGITPIQEDEEERKSREARKKREIAEMIAVSEKRRLRNWFVENSGVGRKYYKESFDTFVCRTSNDRQILESVKAFSKEPKNEMLLLYGNYGTGKTHLGCSVILENGGKYITSGRLCLEYETGADFSAKRTRLEVVDDYATQPMLVIDEVGRCGRSATEKEILSYLISARYDNDLPIVLITNLAKAEIIKFLGEAIFDRMKEVCKSLEFTGESYRCIKR